MELISMSVWSCQVSCSHASIAQIMVKTQGERLRDNHMTVPRASRCCGRKE